MKHLILLLLACAAVSAAEQPATRLAYLSTCETCGYAFRTSTGKSVQIEDHSIKLGGATFLTNYYCRQHSPEFDRILVSSTGRNQHFKRQSEWVALDEMEAPEMREWFRQLRSAESELKLLRAEEQRRIIYVTNTVYVTKKVECYREHCLTIFSGKALTNTFPPLYRGTITTNWNTLELRYSGSCTGLVAASNDVKRLQDALMQNVR
jgi:hypothetical protein